MGGFRPPPAAARRALHPRRAGGPRRRRSRDGQAGGLPALPRADRRPGGGKPVNGSGNAPPGKGPGRHHDRGAALVGLAQPGQRGPDRRPRLDRLEPPCTPICGAGGRCYFPGHHEYQGFKSEKNEDGRAVARANCSLDSVKTNGVANGKRMRPALCSVGRRAGLMPMEVEGLPGAGARPRRSGPGGKPSRVGLLRLHGRMRRSSRRVWRSRRVRRGWGLYGSDARPRGFDSDHRGHHGSERADQQVSLRFQVHGHAGIVELREEPAASPNDPGRDEAVAEGQRTTSAAEISQVNPANSPR